MKRTNYGTFKVVGYITGEYSPLYILSDEAVKYWKDLKNGGEYIALAFENKIHFRKLYWRPERGYGFKFFNRFIYLEDYWRFDATITNGVLDE